MYPMDALQPGIPSPTKLLYNWPAIVTNLYDCFFTIRVYPNDIKKICFSLIQINNKCPHHHFQWKNLPQGMMNLPSMCQLYDHALMPVRKTWPHFYMFYYMDDILVAGPNKE